MSLHITHSKVKHHKFDSGLIIIITFKNPLDRGAHYFMLSFKCLTKKLINELLLNVKAMKCFTKIIAPEQSLFQNMNNSIVCVGEKYVLKSDLV